MDYKSEIVGGNFVRVGLPPALFLSRDPTNKAKALEIFWKESRKLNRYKYSERKSRNRWKIFLKKNTLFKKREGGGSFFLLNL